MKRRRKRIYGRPRKKTKKSCSYSVEEIELLSKIGEGTEGKVYRAKHKKTGEILAVKKWVEIHDTSREIEIMQSLHHPSIVNLKYANKTSGVLVMEYVDNDVLSLLRFQERTKQRFTESEVKCLMHQLLLGVKYIHANKVIHRDIKTYNLLLNNNGELKICDFGSAVKIDGDRCSVLNDAIVVTPGYRAPELMLGRGSYRYSTEIDMWSVGCVMAELMSRVPLIEGVEESDQLENIYRVLGSPNKEAWSGFSELVPKLVNSSSNFVKHKRSKLRQMFPVMCFTGELPVVSNAGFDLLSRLLMYDPVKRITAKEALNHRWFREVPLPKSKNSMPTFPPRED